MSTISPLLSDAYRLVRTDLYGHLDEAELLATKLDDWNDEDVDTACELIPDLVLVIRRILLQHEEGPDGVCPTCQSEWPCPVLCVIHTTVKDPELQFVKILEHARENP